MTAESILKLADKSNKKAVDMKEFTDLILNRFKIEISQEEIVELFAVMNKNKNNLVCID
jgi:Ca2+-binding EF-hand superfamily protein